MMYEQMIDDYLAGSAQLRLTVGDLTDKQLDAIPIVGKWSIRQVICHLADFETIYADRMKRVIVESEPNLPGGDPGKFAASLSYEKRSVRHELEVVSAVRRQMVTILQSLRSADFQRTGIHSRDGALTLEALLRRITEHLPHHVRFIDEKRRALGL
ncbi:MAG: DinB family protein [Planctomycetota bacterium]